MVGIPLYSIGIPIIQTPKIVTYWDSHVYMGILLGIQLDSMSLRLHLYGSRLLSKRPLARGVLSCKNKASQAWENSRTYSGWFPSFSLTLLVLHYVGPKCQRPGRDTYTRRRSRHFYPRDNVRRLVQFWPPAAVPTPKSETLHSTSISHLRAQYSGHGLCYAISVVPCISRRRGIFVLYMNFVSASTAKAVHITGHWQTFYHCHGLYHQALRIFE